MAMRWIHDLRGVNIVAFDSDEPREGDIVLVAHLDTVRNSPGADDNASGVAVALQTARWLSGTGHRAVSVLTDLEELSLLGARQLVRDLPRPKVVVCLDAIGYFNESPGAQRLPPGFGLMFPTLTKAVRARERRGDFLVAVCRRNSLAFATALADEMSGRGVATLTLEDRRWNGKGQSFTRWINPLLLDLDRSDHSPFWRARVPAVMLTGTATLRSPNYHRPADTPDSLDYDRMARTALALSTVLRIGSSGPSDVFA